MTRARPMDELQRHRATLIEYARHRLEDEDWHGLSDAANDLRELDVEIRMTDAAGTSGTQMCNCGPKEDCAACRVSPVETDVVFALSAGRHGGHWLRRAHPLAADERRYLCSCGAALNFSESAIAELVVRASARTAPYRTEAKCGTSVTADSSAGLNTALSLHRMTCLVCPR